MGEYFNWVNVDRKEYICPADFDFGNKLHESLWRGNVFLRALRELLSEEWSGDHVFFMGDEGLIPKDTNNPTLRTIYRHSVQYGCPGNPFDVMCETYRNISGLFKAAEAEVRHEIECDIEDIKIGFDIINRYGVDDSNPFEGLFQRTGRDFRYTLNHTRRIGYAFESTCILYRDGAESDSVDPLPLLMTYGRSADTGAWVGDILGVSDTLPESYELLKRIDLDW